MAKPNYQYEKRARELAKKQKKEEKLKHKKENAARAALGLDPETGEALPTDEAPESEVPAGEPEKKPETS